MGILDEDVVRVREASDIVAIVGQHTALKRVGRRFQGLCPFHAEKTPSFSVNAEDGLYYCFGCQAKGDVITFVREVEHLDFVGAVEYLAGRAGITLRYTDTNESEARKRRGRLVEAVGRAVDWYHERLLSADDAAPARSYLRSRGFDGEMVRSYQIGWAPEGWDELARALRLPDDVFVEAGLGYLNRRGRQTDAFRGRILFPIQDLRGDPVAFGGRILPGGEGPKYKNSADSRIYTKSKVLYGLHRMKAQIVTAGEAIVCEGYTDVIGFAAAGLARAVATCGTALTEDHVRTLTRFAPRVVLAFDADAAGEAAAARFYEWERKYEVEVAVADLPPGRDPAELAREDPPALAKSVENARPFLGFRVDRVLSGASTDTPERRVRAAERAIAVIAEHPSELVRDQYLMQVADRCQVDAQHLRGLLRRGPVPRGERRERTEERPPRITTARLREGPETEALRLRIQRPDAVAESGLVDEVLFADELNVAAWRALESTPGVHAAIERADPAVAELLQQLAVGETDAEVVDVAARLADEAASRELAVVDSELRRLTAAEADNEGPSFRKQIEDAHFLNTRAKRLREDEGDREARVAAIRELVDWLCNRSEGNP